MKGKNKIIGFDLLRIWLSVEVVFDHYWSVHGTDPVTAFFSSACGYAVPCFMLMSFFLTGRHYEESDAPWLRKRYGRLLLPYLFWPVVFYAAFWLGVHFSPVFVASCEKIGAFSHYQTKIVAPVTDLLWQWAFGSSRRNAMQFWFHADLIALTAFFFVLYKVVAARFRAWALTLVVAVSLVLQYAGLTEIFFGWMPFECRYTLGRLAPMALIAALGLAFAPWKGRFAALETRERWFLSLVGLALLFFVHIYRPLASVRSTISYHGLSAVARALGAVMFFYFLPLERLPERLTNFFALVARYCMGIYCIHFSLGWFFYAYACPLLGIGRGTLACNLVIWALSWILCHLIAQIPGRYSKMLVE